MIRKPLILAVAVVILGVVLSMMISKPTIKPMQPNFAFVFAYGWCETNRLDTIRGTYTKDLLTQPSSFVTIRLRLTGAEMFRIYRKMIQIDFFGYPDAFTSSGPFWTFWQSKGIVTPAPEYRLMVRNGGQTKHLHWLDNVTAPTSGQADRLRELMQLIQGVAEARPEVQHLPQRHGGCI